MKQGRTPENYTNETKIAFAVWLGLPESARAEDEKTQIQWSEKYGVTQKTLSFWKKDPQVHAIADNALKTLFSNETFEIIKKMVDDAKGGDWHARRDYLEWQGELGSKIKKTKTPVINLKVVEDND